VKFITPIRGDSVLEMDGPLVVELLQLIQHFRRTVFAVESHNDQVAHGRPPA
jgi:hypothetical protein